MAQQYQRREEFGNAPRTDESRDHNVRKNDESSEDRRRDEFGTRTTAVDPLPGSAYGTAGNGGYGAPGPTGGGAYGMTDYGTTIGGTYDTAGYENAPGDRTAGTGTGTGTGAYYGTATGVAGAGYGSGTTGYGTGGTTGYGTTGAGTGAGQWGRKATTDRGAARGGDRGRDMDMNKGCRD